MHKTAIFSCATYKLTVLDHGHVREIATIAAMVIDEICRFKDGVLKMFLWNLKL